MEKSSGFERKKLSDISNLQGRPKPMNLDLKNKLTTIITPKDYTDKLQKENKELMKLLDERNELIELSIVELRKLRINLQKVQLQNSQLAQANSQMLAELNTGKDRLKVLQHDIACQNGLLNARKVVARERKTRVVASQKPSTEVESSLCDELRKSCQGYRENEPKNGSQRTREQSLGCQPVKPAHTNGEGNKKRRCLRRQSARLKIEDSEAAEDPFDANNGHCAVPSLHDDPVGTHSQILAGSSAKNDKGHLASENACLPVANVVDATKKRRTRRESARFVKTQEPEATEDIFEVKDTHYLAPSLHDDPVGTSGQISAGSSAKNDKEGTLASENSCLPIAVEATKQRRSRRESAKFVKTVQPEAMEDSFMIEDGVFDDSSIHVGNIISASGQITPRFSVKEEGGGNFSSGVKIGESRRSSVGRPLRQAAEKVQSYQESSLRAKMRRPE